MALRRHVSHAFICFQHACVKDSEKGSSIKKEAIKDDLLQS